jgi:hypothetical protein
MATEKKLSTVELTDSQKDEMLETRNKKYYAVFAFFWSFILGGVYTYLFTWKTVGISHLIFFLVFEASAVLPVLIIEKSKGAKRTSMWLFLSLMLGVLSLPFIYRLNVGWGTLAFLTVPIINTILLSAVFNPDTLANFGVLSLIVLPVKMLVAWFVDVFNFFKNIDFSIIKSPKLRSIIGRTLAGCFAGFIALLILVPLLAMADQVFSKVVTDFFQNSFGNWFKDFESTMQTFSKFVVGLGVAGYSSVFLFSLWNKDSYLAKLMKNSDEGKSSENSKTWDVLSVSVFLFVINIVFVLFVVIQFRYFFGGEQNILGLNANYTYADYARRGFSELLIVSIIVYFIALILSLKVYTANLLQKVIFRLNFLVMVASTLVITYAAFARLQLLQETYGFTIVRLLGVLIISAIALMYVFLLVSVLLKSPWKFVNMSSALVIFVSFLSLIIIPTDYVVAKLNYQRYKDTGHIDLPYLLLLEDESIPVQIEMVGDDKVDPGMREIILANLEKKWSTIKTSRTEWQSFNFSDQQNKESLKSLIGKEDSTVFRSKAEGSLKIFLAEYVSLIKAKNYDEAYTNFWSKNSVPLEFTPIKKIEIDNYDVQFVPEFNNWEIASTSDDSHNYWDGMTINLNLQYKVKDSLGSYIFSDTICKDEVLTLVIEDGSWKIINATQITLGNFKDKGNDRANYYQNSSLDHLINSTYSTCSDSYWYDSSYYGD